MKKPTKKQILMVLKSIFPTEKIEEDPCLDDRYIIYLSNPTTRAFVNARFFPLYMDVILTMYVSFDNSPYVFKKLLNDKNLIINYISPDCMCFEVISLNLNSFEQVVI